MFYPQYAPLVWGSAAGGKRNYKEAVRLMHSGIKADVPDIAVMVPKLGYLALFIELKRPEERDEHQVRVTKGEARDGQMKMLERLNRQGYLAVVCYGADEAFELFERYVEPNGDVTVWMIHS